MTTLTSGPPPTKEWAFLACIAQPADFSPAGLQDVEDLCNVGASDEVYVGVDRDTMGDHQGAIRYEISEPDYSGKARRIVLERRDKQTGNSPDAIATFAQWAISRFPAKYRLMVIWGHGFGFRPFGTYNVNMPALQRALRKGMEAAGLSERLTILGFDSCLMNTVEVTYELRSVASIIVGSQETEPYEGWPYGAVLASVKSVAADTAGDARTLAGKIVDDYVADHRGHGRAGVTHSAVLTDEAEACVTALGALGSVLKGRLPLPGARTELEKTASVVLRFRADEYADLGHLASLLQQSGDPKTRAAATALGATVPKVVFASESFALPRDELLRNATGLSVWFPQLGKEFLKSRATYKELSIASNHGGWLEFLDAYHGE